MKKRTFVSGTCLMLALTAVLNAGLVQHHTFDGTLADAAGSNPGVMVGGDPNYVDSEIGQGLQFFQGRYVDLGVKALPDPNNAPQGAISLWFKAVTTTSDALLGTSNAVDGTALNIQFESNLNLRVMMRDAANQIRQVEIDGAKLRFGQWRHLVVVYELQPVLTLTIYIDGQPQPQIIVANGNPQVFSAWQYPLTVGARNNRGVIERSFVGFLDDIRVYDHALSALEVAALYTTVRPDESICAVPPALDLDGDCRVGLAELLAVAGDWLNCGLVPACVQ